MHDEGFVDAATRDKDWVGYLMLILTGREPIDELQRCMDAITRFTQSKTKAELFDEAIRRRVLIVPVSTVEDIAHDTQLAARDYWTPVAHDDPDASILYPGPFARFSATPIRYGRRAPLTGEHTAEFDVPSSKFQVPSQQSETPNLERGTSNLELPLTGLKVLDLSWVFATPVVCATSPTTARP